jgi:nicotinamidase-related amidase
VNCGGGSRVSDHERPTPQEIAVIATAVLDPARTALLVIDAQEEYFTPGGANELPDGPAALGRVGELLHAAREAGAQVVHVRHVSDHPLSEEFRVGTPGVEIRPEVAPADGEAVLDKRMPSAFVGTPLEAMLRERGVETVIVSGFMTQTCCMATAHESLSRRYRTIFAEDATAAQDYGPQPAAQVHERAVATQRQLGAEVLSASSIAELLRPTAA